MIHGVNSNDTFSKKEEESTLTLLKIEADGAREMAWWLGALVAGAEGHSLETGHTGECQAWENEQTHAPGQPHSSACILGPKPINGPQHCPAVA